MYCGLPPNCLGCQQRRIQDRRICKTMKTKAQKLSAWQRGIGWGVVLVFLALATWGTGRSSAQNSTPAVPSQDIPKSTIGREVSVPAHLRDGQEFSLSLESLLAHGKLLFSANWTEQEGGGRPLTKGTGRPLSDPSQPLTGMRAFNRISAPDANSCVACHSVPYGIAGGGGDFVTNVFLLGQRFDFLTFDPADKLPTRGAVDESGQPASLLTAADLRGSTGLFGSGYLEMLARQM